MSCPKNPHQTLASRFLDSAYMEYKEYMEFKEYMAGKSGSPASICQCHHSDLLQPLNSTTTKLTIYRLKLEFLANHRNYKTILHDSKFSWVRYTDIRYIINLEQPFRSFNIAQTELCALFLYYHSTSNCVMNYSKPMTKYIRSGT